MRAEEMRSMADMEQDMRVAKIEMEQRKREAENKEESERKKAKIATPGRIEPGTPRTSASVRSRHGL